MAQTRKNRILPLILVLVCAAVMLRSAFTGLEIDEEYALSLGYRLVSGDRLFYDMWEPHQLSSLPAAALLAMFIGITGGTTGVLVFFRLVVLACKAGMSCVFYRMMNVLFLCVGKIQSGIRNGSRGNMKYIWKQENVVLLSRRCRKKNRNSRWKNVTLSGKSH